MKWTIASIAFTFIFGFLQAEAGHEVGNGNLTSWTCSGHASLTNSTGTRAMLPFVMRLNFENGTKTIEVNVLDQRSHVLFSKAMVADSAVYFKASGLVEIKSFKESKSLTKELQAFAVLRKVGQILAEPVHGTLTMSLENHVTLVSHTMKCKDYF